MKPKPQFFQRLPLLLLLVAGGAAAAPDCGDTEAALEYWRPVREQPDDPARPADVLALELVDCLGSPNAELRDGIGYELFAHWLRANRLSNDTRRALLVRLGRNLGDSDSGLRRSFSALVLAEIMRSDALSPFMSAEERDDLLQKAISALGAETDFRGLTTQYGWVHPVAHMADLQWRFALHPETTPEQATPMLDAIAGKVSTTAVAYTFGEGDRLARVVAILIRRELVAPDDMADWLRGFEMPRSMARWGEAFRSTAGMAELHNTRQFLRALSDQLEGQDLPEPVRETLDGLVAGFTELI